MFSTILVLVIGLAIYVSTYSHYSHAKPEVVKPKAPLLKSLIAPILKGKLIETPSKKAPLLNKIVPFDSNENANEKPNELPSSSREPEIVIHAINIVGNDAIATDTIIKQLKIKPGDPFSEIKLILAVKNIKSMGYFESVTSQTETQNNHQHIIITVKENPIVSDIIITGNHIIDTATLTQLIDSKPHSIFNLAHARHDIKAINEYYEEKYYSKAKVYRVISPKKSGDPLRIYISEGIIESIVITGNNKTRDYVILRELDIKPGSVINDNDIKKNLRRVFNLNYFNNVYPNFIPTQRHNEYQLELNLEERETSGSFTFGGGYSPTGGFSIFSDLFWDNLYGTGQSILLKYNRGVGNVDGDSNSRSTYQLRYHNPWMWDTRKSFTFRTWRTSGNSSSFMNNQFSLNSELRRGFDVAIGVPSTYELRFSHKVKYEKVHLNDINKSYDIYSYTIGMSHDTRDVHFNPREGHFYTAYVENGIQFRQNALKFTQIDVSLRQFFPTFEKQVIALRADHGYIRSPKINDRDLFRSQIYTIGGSESVRGYDDFSPITMGNIKALYSAEYRFLFTNVFQLVLFVVAGFATYSKKEIVDYQNYTVGKGVGLRFNVPPIGPIRLDFGWDNKGEMRMHFNIGHAF